jgi:hypothetical protein
MSDKVVMHSPAKAIKMGSCFGHYDANDKTCGKCVVNGVNFQSPYSCKVATEVRKKAQSQSEPDVEKISPMDYLMKSLQGSLDLSIEKNDKAISYDFSQDGIRKVRVISIIGSEKVMIMAQGFKEQYDNLESVEFVEGILKQLL